MSESPHDTIDVPVQTPDREFNYDSKIWALYLEDAERAAKERVELMKSGLLDSILIFAGLFAGVVSSFVIDARRDIQIDSEQNLLSDIRDVLRNPGSSVIDIVHIPVSATWISALWLVSLYLTLFSAIMGILAKAWLANLIPTSTRRQASDAYRRYKLDIESTSYLQPAITLMFLLIQIASIMFLVGLIVQGWNDQQTLGHVLLALCLIGFLIYLFMGFLPLVTSLSSFRTPLSDLVSLKILWTQATHTVNIKDINECLGEIFYAHLIQSPDASRVDQAVAELTLPDFREERVQVLCRNDAPERMLACFRLCASMPTDDLYRQKENLSNYLLVFLRFAHQFEADRLKVEFDLKNYPTLLPALATLLEPGNPLHRRNNPLPEPLRPLQLALRLEILCLFKQIHADSPQALPPHLVDIHHTEMEVPWEVFRGDIRSSHRLHVMLAACRGVLQAENNVMKASSLVLGLSIAKAACAAEETRPSEQGIDGQAANVLSKLSSVMVSTWEDMAVDAINNSPSLIRSAERETHEEHGILEAIVSGLAATNRTFQLHAIRMLKQVPGLKPDLFGETPISVISNIIVYQDEGIREDGLEILVNLAESSENSKTMVTTALCASIDSGFHRELEQCLRTVRFIRHLWKLHVASGLSLLNLIIHQCVPGLVEVALNADWPDVRQPAWDLVSELSSIGSVTLEDFSEEELKKAIPRSFGAGLDNPETRKRLHTLNKLSELRNYDGSEDAPEKPPYAFLWKYSPHNSLLVDIFPFVFEKIVQIAILDDDGSIAKTAQTLLKQLSEDVRLVGCLKANAIGWLEISESGAKRWIWSDSSSIRLNALLVLEFFIDHANFSNEAFERLINWAGTDRSDDVRCFATKLMSMICQRDRSRLSADTLEVVKSAIGSVKDQVVEAQTPYSLFYSARTRPGVRSLWIRFLHDVVKLTSFPEVAPILVELYLSTSDDSEAWKTVHRDFGPSGAQDDPKYISALKDVLPQALEVTIQGSRRSWPRTAQWIKLLVAFSQKPTLKKKVDKILKGVADDLRKGIKASSEQKPVEQGNRDEHDDERQSLYSILDMESLLPRGGQAGIWIWADILATIATYDPGEFQDAPTILFEMARHDPDTKVKCACLRSLILLAKEPSCSFTSELRDGVIKHYEFFLDTSDWAFGSWRSITPLEDPDVLNTATDGLPDKVLQQLSSNAASDSDHDCRSEAINTFRNLLKVRDGERDQPPKGGCCEYVETMVKEHFNEGIKDRSWKVRQSWIKLAGTQIENAESPALITLLNVAVRDGDSDMQAEAVQVLRQGLEDASSRRSIAAKLGEALGVRLSATSTEDPDRVLTVLKTITAPPSAQGKDFRSNEVREGYELWVQIISLLSRHVEFRALPKLIEVVLKEGPSDSTFASPRSLYSLFQNVKLPDPIDSILPKAIEIALEPTALSTVRSAAVNLFARLIVHDDYSGLKYENLLGRSRDSQIISRLVDITIEDKSGDIRTAALQVLKAAYKATTATGSLLFGNPIKTFLTKIIENTLKDTENPQFRENALSVVDSLTEENSKERFTDIVFPSISQLFKTALLGGDKRLGDVVKRLLSTDSADDEIVKNVLITIPPTVAFLNGSGKAIAMQLIETVAIPKETATAVVRALTTMLQNESPSARGTCLELLLKLCAKRSDDSTFLTGPKHYWPDPEVLLSAIPGIIGLAFDDKPDGAESLRVTAIHLLVALVSQESTLLSQPIIRLAIKFMGLLEVESLRAPVVKLLTRISVDETARRTIALGIAARALDAEKVGLEGHVELLTRLISEGLLQSTPTDYMLLFLAPALVASRDFASYRLRLLTALWCRYSRSTLNPKISVNQKELLEWFKLAVFGQHITPREAVTWRARHAVWIPRSEWDLPSLPES